MTQSIARAPDGVMILPLKEHKDFRGTFTEFAVASVVGMEFKQVNILRTRAYCCRGLHMNTIPQYKLVTVLEGEMLQVLVDFRRPRKK